MTKIICTDLSRFDELGLTKEELKQELIRIEKILINMIRDYLHYGYNLKFFIEQDYPITQSYGVENLKKLWTVTLNKWEKDF